jgi:citrate synthase
LESELDRADEENPPVVTVLRSFFSNRSFIPGFGVPYRDNDERVPPMWRCLRRRGRDGLAFVQLFAMVGEFLEKERGIKPNIAGLTAAICLDIGFTAEEIGTLLIAFGMHMFVANAHEGARQSTAALQQLPEEYIRYVGRPPRTSPRALAQELENGEAPSSRAAQAERKD